jgi:TPR repeat protein
VEKMFYNFITNSKKKIQSLSRTQALISFTAFAVLLSPLKTYGMDLPGDAETHWVLSNRYAQGEGVENEEKSMKHLRQAADLGHAKANFKLGESYEDGGNIDIAYKYYQIAADLGYPEAQIELGLGLLDSDKEKALQYFQLAADQSDVQGILLVASMHSHDFVKAFEYMSSKPIREYVPTGDEELNHMVGTALYTVGNVYVQGVIIQRDLGMAFQYFKLSADQEFGPALEKLGDIFGNKEGDFIFRDKEGEFAKVFQRELSILKEKAHEVAEQVADQQERALGEKELERLHNFHKSVLPLTKGPKK